MQRFERLLFFLVFMILLSPVCRLGIPHVDNLFRLVFIILLASVVHRFRINQPYPWVYWGLLLPLLVSGLTSWILPLNSVLITADFSFFILFGLYCVYSLFHYIFDQRLFTDNQMFWGAACGYVVFGITWGAFYHTLFIFLPQSFTNVSHWTDFLYFSFVTLTTMGYGDIAPVHPLARMLSIVEAMFGVLYTSLLVAKLVGLYALHQTPVVKDDTTA
jgi:hypothetical protein